MSVPKFPSNISLPEETSSIDNKFKKQDSMFTNMMYNLTNIKKMLKQMMVQWQHFSLDEMESP